MLATLVAEAFDLPGWVYEEKYDGYRILAYKEGRQVRLLSRNDNDRTDTFAGVAEAIARLPERTLLLDGEVVVFDPKGVSRFQLLQRGGAHAYAVFDCLYRGGRDLRRVPLEARRAEVADGAGRRLEEPVHLSPAREGRPRRLPRRPAARLRGPRREGRVVPLRGASEHEVAQGQGSPGGRVRDRRVHAAARRAVAPRRASARRVRGPRASLRRQGRNRVLREDARRAVPHAGAALPQDRAVRQSRRARRARCGSSPRSSRRSRTRR